LWTYHGHTLTDGGRECRSVGVHHTTRLESVFFLLGEVEEPIRVLWQQVHPVEVGVGHSKLGNQIGVYVGVDCQSHGRHDGEDDKSKSEKNHGESLPVEATATAGGWCSGGAGLLGGKLLKLDDCCLLLSL